MRRGGGRSYVRIEDGGTNQESEECRRVMKKLLSVLPWTMPNEGSAE